MTWIDELAVKTDMLLTHHGRHRRETVRPGLPDVFVTQGLPRDYDIALRIDGGYSDKRMADGSAQYWQELLDSINALRRAHYRELHEGKFDLI